MHSLLRNTIGVIGGILVGGIVNMFIIGISHNLMPMPSGFDHSSYEALEKTMHLLGPQHYLFPFLAHALGSFFGALVAIKIGASHFMRLAMIVGIFFLMSGMNNTRLIPAPIWFNALDVLIAYLPMVWLAHRLAAPKPL